MTPRERQLIEELRFAAEFLGTDEFWVDMGDGEGQRSSVAMAERIDELCDRIERGEQ